MSPGRVRLRGCQTLLLRSRRSSRTGTFRCNNTCSSVLNIRLLSFRAALPLSGVALEDPITLHETPSFTSWDSQLLSAGDMAWAYIVHFVAGYMSWAISRAQNARDCVVCGRGRAALRSRLRCNRLTFLPFGLPCLQAQDAALQ